MSWLFLLPLLIFAGAFAAFELGALSSRQQTHGTGTSSPLNGAIYALLGLLVAFSFNGAYQRFHERSQLTIEESIRVQDMASMLELLSAEDTAQLKPELLSYLQSRIAIYAAFPDEVLALQRFQQSRMALQRLQSAVYRVVSSTDDRAISSQLMARMAAVRAIEARRVAATRAHPPAILFLLMTTLALVVSFLAGHDHGHQLRRPLLQTSLFAAVFALITWVIVDMEYPRLGLLMADMQDALLDELLITISQSPTSQR
jgi:hypothetical protein